MDAIATIADMVREAEKHADDLSADRIRAIEYYQGEMQDTPADTGRSQMVSRDVRANIKKVLPSLVRTILGSDTVAEYQPVGPDDEQGAEQASDYVNSVIVPECDLRRVIEDALHDALLLRNGILRWWWEEKQCVSISSHSGLSDDAFAELVSGDDTEVLEHSEGQEMVDGPEGPVPVTVHDVKIRRTTVERKPRAACVPRERFLIHPDATTLDDSLLTGEIMQVTRSDLIAMGYDKDTVMGLSQAKEDDYESDIRRDFVEDSDESHMANQQLDYYDIYVRYDMDGDGISELRHMCFAGGLHERNLLHDEECDEIQFADVKVMSQPHQWEGISLADDLMDIQRAKTVLVRQTLDNLYWQNNPQPIMQDDVVKNPDAVFNPEFGLPIRVREGFDVRQAVNFAQVPFVAAQSFEMLNYFDGEAQDRTGVSDASAGLEPDALQNMTATASEMINQASIGQTEMMVRTAAEGLRKFFRGMLRLITRHQDIPRTVRLNGEWVEFDPRHWNADMDCSVNIGLGAGTRERDMQVMQYVMGLQEKLLAAFGPDNPYVKPENLWEALSRTVEAAGLKTPSMYFTEPDPEEIAQKLAQAAQNNPEAEKIQAEMQAKQADVQAKVQIEQAKMQTQREKERAQMEADLEVERARLQADAVRQEQQLAWEREKFAQEMQFKRDQMEQDRQDAIWKHQAEQMNTAQEAANG